MRCTIGCVPVRESRLIAFCFEPCTSCATAFQLGLRSPVTLLAIQLAKPSLSHRSSHQPIVTRSPNHWCATSCATVPNTFWRSVSLETLGSTSTARSK